MGHHIRRCLGLILLLAPVFAVVAVEPFRVTGTTNADNLRVRAQPTLTGEIIGSLAAGTPIEIVSVTPEEMVIGGMSARWYQIRSLPGVLGMDGWSYGHFIDVSPEDLLAVGIWTGQMRLVRDLIDQNVAVNAPLREDGLVFSEYDEYEYRSTPLMEAVRAGATEFVDMLLDAGANPDTESSHGEPGGVMRRVALVDAVRSGNIHLVAALVDAGADLELEMTSFGGGGDGFNLSPLTAAVTSGDARMVEYLLSAGAEVNHAVRYWSTFGGGDTMKTALDIASEMGLMEIAFHVEAAGGSYAEKR